MMHTRLPLELPLYRSVYVREREEEREVMLMCERMSVLLFAKLAHRNELFPQTIRHAHLAVRAKRAVHPTGVPASVRQALVLPASRATQQANARVSLFASRVCYVQVSIFRCPHGLSFIIAFSV